MTWYKIIKRKVNGIEEVVYEEQKHPLDVDNTFRVLPKVIQLYNAS